MSTHPDPLSIPVTIVSAGSPGERRTALCLGDAVVEAWVERPAMPDGVGDLHRARVAAIAPAMAGAFVTLAGGDTGFLPESEAGPKRQPIGQSVHEGMAILVRITRAAQGGKGPRLTARLPQDGAAGAPALLARGPDAPLRLAQAHPTARVRTDDAALATRLRAALSPDRVGYSPAGVFDDALEHLFDALAEPAVPLPGGGGLLFHPTPALIAIDVDAGSAAGSPDPEAQRRLNQAAITEAARQIRLRNLAGPILLDLAGLGTRQRSMLEAPLAAALAGDPLARLLGLGPLGLFEILRQRIHPPLHEVLGFPPTPLTHGLAALRRAVREAAASPGRRLALSAAPAVLEALARLPGALAEAAAAIGTPLLLRPDAALPWGAATLAPADG